MVSLNEKRSKIRYAVQNKTEWVDDGNKFGKRMLEKMGWQTGSGLGKKEDGITEHIDLKFKSNLKGVGFVNGKYDDTWIAHSQSFDSVLQKLQQSHPTSSSTTLNNFNQTVQQTKTRFTYKKQSSGKDLSSRTNDELDCIFGWNKGNQIKQNNIQLEQQQQKESETISDNLYVTSKTTIYDYFKDKSKIKKDQKSTEENQSVDEQIPSQQTSADQEDNQIDNTEEEEQQSKKTKKRKKEESSTNEDVENPYEGSNINELNGYKGWNIDSSIDDIIKKKHKQKKRKNKFS